MPDDDKPRAMCTDVLYELATPVPLGTGPAWGAAMVRAQQAALELSIIEEARRGYRELGRWPCVWVVGLRTEWGGREVVPTGVLGQGGTYHCYYTDVLNELDVDADTPHHIVVEKLQALAAPRPDFYEGPLGKPFEPSEDG